MRSHKFITSAMLCSITSTPQPYVGTYVQDELAQLFGFGRRKPGGRLVEQEKARIDGERARKPDAPLLAIAQAGRRPMRLVGELQRTENVGRTPPRLVAGKPLPHIAGLDILADAQPAKQAAPPGTCARRRRAENCGAAGACNHARR